MKKYIILIPLTIQFSVRYIIRTSLLERIREFAYPIIVLGWKDEQLKNELTAQGIEVYELPRLRMGRKYARLRKKIQTGHFRRIKSISTSIDMRRREISLAPTPFFLSRLRGAYYSLISHLPGVYERWLSLDQSDALAETNFQEYLSLIETIDPDIVFSITPYLPEEEFLIRAANYKKLKLITAILSFDNITTRPRLPALFDHYLLWNEINKQELLRIYPQVQPEQIEIVGSPQFDFYYDPSFLWDESTWRKTLSIPPEKQVILFGAGPESITPVEPHIAAQLDQAIDQGLIKGEPVILLRLHPVDTPTRWEPLMKSAKHIIFDIPWQLGEEITGKTNVTRYDIEKLASTLKYCQVHINTSSTMTIDGAIFDRPQIGPAYDDRPGRKFDRCMRELYLREHYLPITKSGGLKIVYSIDQLIDEINDGFEHPEKYRNERMAMVRTLCTFDDGKSALRVSTALHEFIDRGPRNQP